MFGFIKNLFAGILGFFGGLFGGKKSENAPKTRKGKGYFLELDETAVSQTSNGKAVASEPAKAEAAPVAEPAAVKAAPAKEPAAVKAAAPVAAAPAKVEAAPAPKPEPAPVAAPVPVAKENPQPQPDKTFAPNYLLSLSSSNGRRRPGANMNSFLDMARQVKPST